MSNFAKGFAKQNEGFMDEFTDKFSKFAEDYTHQLERDVSQSLVTLVYQAGLVFRYLANGGHASKADFEQLSKSYSTAAEEARGFFED